MAESVRVKIVILLWKKALYFLFCIYYQTHWEDQVPRERDEEAKFLIAPFPQLLLRLKNVCQVVHSTPTVKQVRPANFEYSPRN